MLKAYLKKHWFIFTSIVAFVILRLPSLFEPYWYGDEGIYLVLGQAIRKGLILYTQIHDNKPPTLYYLATIAHSVFGFRLLLAFFMAGAYYYFYLLSKKFFTGYLLQISTILFIVLTSIPLIEGNIANAEVFMLLPTLAGIYYFFKTPTQKYRLVIAGLLLGIAFTIKIPVAVEFGFLCFWLLIFTKNTLRSKFYDLTTFSISFIFPFVLYLIYFSFKGAFSGFMFAAILQNFGYLSSWQTGTHSGGSSNSGLILRAVALFLSWLFIYFLTKKKQLTNTIAIITLWFTATIFGALLSTRPYPHYLIQVAPPFILLIILVFEKKISQISRTILIVSLISFGLLVSKYKFYTYSVFSYYSNFYSQLTATSSNKYRSYFGGRVDNSYKISDYIKQVTVATDKIFVWGDEPYIYALSDRLPVDKFTVAYHIVDFNQFENTYNQLITTLPPLIVYFPQEGRPYPKLEKLLQNYYYPATSFDQAIIYRLR